MLSIDKLFFLSLPLEFLGFLCYSSQTGGRDTKLKSNNSSRCDPLGGGGSGCSSIMIFLPFSKATILAIVREAAAAAAHLKVGAFVAANTRVAASSSGNLRAPDQAEQYLDKIKLDLG
ncbi:hypothetical protein EDD22DRAFT_852590 [Suillus occidentalis]|nr:hypothetical protein EDD22DRAFT_852590 [Suillus occidentalis]